MIRVTAALQLCSAVFVSVLCAQAVPSQGGQWRHNGVCYEVFVRSFFDSDGDGVGDLRGLTQKLDYINDGKADTQRDLGANCI